jgi:hypothetical protein
MGAPSGAIWDNFSPSTVAYYGAGTAVSAMSNTQLSTYYYSDVSLGASGVGSTGLNSLKQRLADGRITGPQDFADKIYILNKLGFSQNL